MKTKIAVLAAFAASAIACFGAISSVTSVTNLPSGKELYVAPGDYAFADGVSATNGTANAIIFTER